MLDLWGFRVRGLAASISIWWCTVMVLGCGPEVAEEYPMCPKGPAPVCGEPCGNSCGCEFAVETLRHCQGDLIVTANGNCYQPVDFCAPGACTSPPLGDEPVHCAETCEQVKQAYQWALPHAAYVESGGETLAPGAYNVRDGCRDDHCAVNSGHCAQGLATCWYLGPKNQKLDQLAALYEQLGCSTESACDCPEPPTDLECGPLSEEYWRGAHQDGCMMD